MRNLAALLPGIKYGHRVFPNEIAGMIGLPSVGNIFYVDPGAGSDTANAGKDVNDAFASVTAAKAAMIADNDDVCIMAGTSSTGRTSEVAAIDWNKRRTHIIGNGPMRKINPRNGIGFAAAATGDPSFTVSEKDCSFTNISLAQFNNVNVLTNITGDYNSWNNVHFQGIGNATAGDDTAARSLLLTGAEENEFINCTIGLDTVTRSTTNASLELTGACPRNKFIGCDFPMFADNAGALWLKADTGNCYERFLKFENCDFMNPDGASSTTLTIGFDLSTTGNGDIYMLNCNWRGATDLANNYDRLFTNSPTVDTANQGLVIVQAT